MKFLNAGRGLHNLKFPLVPKERISKQKRRGGMRLKAISSQTSKILSVILLQFTHDVGINTNGYFTNAHNFNNQFYLFTLLFFFHNSYHYLTNFILLIAYRLPFMLKCKVYDTRFFGYFVHYYISSRLNINWLIVGAR